MRGIRFFTCCVMLLLSFVVVLEAEAAFSLSNAKKDLSLVFPGSAVQFSASFTSTTSAPVFRGFQLFAPNGAEIAKQFTQVTLQAGVSSNATFPFTMPAGAALGRYRLAVNVHSGSGWQLLTENPNAVVFDVTVRPSIKESITWFSKDQLYSGNEVKLTGSYVSSASVANVDGYVRVYNSSGVLVHSQLTQFSFVAGATAYTNLKFNIPSTFAPGSYRIATVIQTRAATVQELFANNNAGTLMVLTPLPVLPPNPVLSAAPADGPPGSSYVPPARNLCNSLHDEFYANEPGVHAYWALCEAGTNPALYDYVGKFPVGALGAIKGVIQGGFPGPVSDGETAAKITDAAAGTSHFSMPINRHQGTIATWIHADSSTTWVDALRFYPTNSYLPDGGRSALALSFGSTGSDLCFRGALRNSSAVRVDTPWKCVGANAWHRVAVTWSQGLLKLFVDGKEWGSTAYSGLLDALPFTYQLFPQAAAASRQIAMAKALVSNQAWSAAEVLADFNGPVVKPPPAGVIVTNRRLGRIHRDVLGYADINSDLASASALAAHNTGLDDMGIASVRYASGSGGSLADGANWRGGAICTKTKGVSQSNPNISTQNNLDNFMERVAKPRGLHVGYTVNYGSNAPACTAGGDPIENGANLVDYANNTMKYGIKYWEIGNEQYAGYSGGWEIDFHTGAGQASSYITNAKQFYTAMKAKDPTISIGVPIVGNSWLSWDDKIYHGAAYDAVVWHNYPMSDPVSDGETLFPDRVVAKRGRTRANLRNIQTNLLAAGKSPDSLWITEWDGTVGGGKWSRQTMGIASALFTAMELGEYFQAGVPYATWWGQARNTGCVTYYYDPSAGAAYNWYDCGQHFLVRTNPTEGEVNVGMQVGDLTPAARVFQMFSKSGFVSEGEYMEQTYYDKANASWLMSYAATHGRTHALVLINRDRNYAHSLPVQIEGKAWGSGAVVWSYGRDQYDQTYFKDWSTPAFRSTVGPWKGQFVVNLPRWSVNIIMLVD